MIISKNLAKIRSLQFGAGGSFNLYVTFSGWSKIRAYCLPKAHRKEQRKKKKQLIDVDKINTTFILLY